MNGQIIEIYRQNLKKVCVRFLILSFSKMHLTTTLSDNSHNERMRDSRFDPK
jgi:hypothetical protein